MKLDGCLNYSIGGNGGGQVVSMLNFYSGDTSLNPSEFYSFYTVKIVRKERK